MVNLLCARNMSGTNHWNCPQNVHDTRCIPGKLNSENFWSQIWWDPHLPWLHITTLSQVFSMSPVSWSWFLPFAERQIHEWPTLLKLYTNNTNALPATNWEAYARQPRHSKRSATPPTCQLSSTRCLSIQILNDNWRQEYLCWPLEMPLAACCASAAQFAAYKALLLFMCTIWADGNIYNDSKWRVGKYAVSLPWEPGFVGDNDLMETETHSSTKKVFRVIRLWNEPEGSEEISYKG